MDLPGVNARGKTREKLIESLKIGSADMMMITPFEPAKEEDLVSIEI